MVRERKRENKATRRKVNTRFIPTPKHLINTPTGTKSKIFNNISTASPLSPFTITSYHDQNGTSLMWRVSAGVLAMRVISRMKKMYVTNKDMRMDCVNGFFAIRCQMRSVAMKTMRRERQYGGLRWFCNML